MQPEGNEVSCDPFREHLTINSKGVFLYAKTEKIYVYGFYGEYQRIQEDLIDIIDCMLDPTETKFFVYHFPDIAASDHQQWQPLYCRNQTNLT